MWSVAHNKRGDILVGTEDKKIRTFTKDLSRKDDGPDLTEYQEECKGNAKTQMPDMAQMKEFKTQVEGKVRGKKEGDIQVFKDEGKAKAYMWKEADSKWEEIGEVVDPSGNAQ